MGQPVGLLNHLCGAACRVNAGQPVSYVGQPVIAQTNLKKLRVAKPTRSLTNEWNLRDLPSEHITSHVRQTVP